MGSLLLIGDMVTHRTSAGNKSRVKNLDLQTPNIMCRMESLSCMFKLICVDLIIIEQQSYVMEETPCDGIQVPWVHHFLFPLQ